MDKVLFPHLKSFSAFVLKNHLENFTNENILLAKKLGLPANNIIFNWKEDEYRSFIRNRTEIFLNFFSREDPVGSAIEELEKWKNDNLPKVEGRILNIEDLTGSFTIRRIILTKLLTHYTKDPDLCIEIMNEFNLFYHGWEKGAFRMLFELQNSHLIQEIELRTHELSNKNKELQKINADLDDFVYTASHDLKAPVSNIDGLMKHLEQLLNKRNAIDDEIKPVMDMIGRSVNRFQDTISDLTQISKIQKNLEEDVEEVDLVALIEEVKMVLDSSIKETMAEIMFIYSQLYTINFSKKYLRSIFYNLISNAINYRSPERAPRIQISFEKTETLFTVRVSDNGLGIKKEAIPKIFEMFKRLHAHGEGTGVGLYLVKRIIENSGGTIEVESEEGVGSTFILVFNIDDKQTISLNTP